MRLIKPMTRKRHDLKLPAWTMLALCALAIPCLDTLADSTTVSETWKDNTAGGDYFSSTDTGTFNASLSIPGLASFTANDWSNLVISVNSDSADSLFIGEDSTGTPGNFSDFMADAPNQGGSVSATNATFVFQLTDTNGTPQNAFQMSFSRSGNTLSINGKTLNPPSLGTSPWSIVAWNYFDPSGLGVTFGITNDPVDCEIILQNTNTLEQYADIVRTIYVNGINVITYDSQSYELFNIKVTGAADYTPPVLTAVSPPGSPTTTNDLLTAQVKATDNIGVANVEFFLNGSDYGPGVVGPSNLWFLSFALRPGTNVIQTLATDLSGNNSPTNTVFVNYVNRQTNANTITFFEHWLDSAQTDSFGNPFDVSQDVGTLNAALVVPGLQSLSASTWSNLLLTISFGDIAYSNTLSLADVLTTNRAVFYLNQVFDPNSNLVTDIQMSLVRSGNSLVLAYETANPTYDPDNPIIADYYYGSGGPIHDVQPFELTLQDGNTLNFYANFAQPVFISGSDATNFDAAGNELDNIQVSGQADFTPPTVQITAPLPNQLWSNAAFTVTGKAGDNVQVSDVFYSVNAAAWTSANPINHWTNWSAQVTLAPGTNTIAACAVDTSGNPSPTNTVKLFYVVNTALTVSTNGPGAITPSDNGALLAIGRNYTLTATALAGSGFAFTNWTGGTNLPLSILTNRATLVFQMAPNLKLQANFVDTNKPVCSITNLAAGQRVSNTVFTVRGRASDNVQVAGVWLQFNGGAWSNPLTTNQWTNWSAVLNLLPGTNRVAAFAVDTSGNFSPTNSLSFLCVPAGAAFPIATGKSVQIGTGVAFNGTNYLAAILGSASVASNLTAQMFSATGSLLGTRLPAGRTGDVPGGLPMIASSGSNYLMVWEDNATSNALTYGQFISSTGALQGASFPLSTHGSAKINLAPPGVAFGGGQFLVVWNDDRNGNYDIYGRLAAPGGTLSPEIEIAAGLNGEKEPAVAFDGANFLVVWEHQTSTGPEQWDVYATLVATDGTPGSPFQINQTSSPRYNPLSVAFDGTNYLAVWNRDNGGGGTNQTIWDIYGSIVTPAGAVSVSEIPVAADAGSQIFPQLAFGQGNYLITWGAHWGTTSNTVAARFFSPNGQTNGPEFAPFAAVGASQPLLAGVTYDGTRFVSVATLGVINTSTHQFTNGAVYGAFIDALASSPVIPGVVQNQPLVFASAQGGLTIANGSLQVQLSGPTNAVVVIESSPDLIHWQPVQTNTLTTGVSPLSLPVDSQPAEFIRARLQPTQ